MFSARRLLLIAALASASACTNSPSAPDWSSAKADASGEVQRLSYGEAIGVLVPSRDDPMHFAFQAQRGDQVVISATSESDPALVLFDDQWFLEQNDDCSDCEAGTKNARIDRTIERDGLHELFLFELGDPLLIGLKLECVGGPCASTRTETCNFRDQCETPNTYCQEGLTQNTCRPIRELYDDSVAQLNDIAPDHGGVTGTALVQALLLRDATAGYYALELFVDGKYVRFMFELDGTRANNEDWRSLRVEYTDTGADRFEQKWFSVGRIYGEVPADLASLRANIEGDTSELIKPTSLTNNSAVFYLDVKPLHEREAAAYLKSEYGIDASVDTQRLGYFGRLENILIGHFAP